MPSIFSSLLRGIGKLGASAVEVPGSAIGRGVKSIWSGLASTKGKGFKEGAKILGKEFKTGAESTADASSDFISSFSTVYSKATIAGKGFSAVGRGGKWAGRKLFHAGGSVMDSLSSGYRPHAIVGASLLGGITYGAGTTVINRSNERTMASAGRGMPANNLGTDGLTLALSRRRHT